MTLRVSETIIEQIRQQGESAYPAECCGALAGHPGEIKHVLQLIPMQNRRTDDPHRYLIAPDDLLRTMTELRRSDLEVLGYYHSHPDHAPTPSAFDTEHAWPWYSYVIVQVNRGRSGEVAAWVLADDRSRMGQELLEVFTEV
jgi:proteasome lid subunit RPN8/RPN11